VYLWSGRLRRVSRCHPYAFLKSGGRDHHPAPTGFETKGALEQRIEDERATLPELADRYDVDIDCSGFSETGRRAFCPDA